MNDYTGLCRYSAAHLDAKIPATSHIRVDPIGVIPCCARCKAFYEKYTK